MFKRSVFFWITGIILLLMATAFTWVSTQFVYFKVSSPRLAFEYDFSDFKNCEYYFWPNLQFGSFKDTYILNTRLKDKKECTLCVKLYDGTVIKNQVKTNILLSIYFADNDMNRVPRSQASKIVIMNDFESVNIVLPCEYYKAEGFGARSVPALRENTYQFMFLTYPYVQESVAVLYLEESN